jgi:hypothetical protein
MTSKLILNSHVFSKNVSIRNVFSKHVFSKNVLSEHLSIKQLACLATITLIASISTPANGYEERLTSPADGASYNWGDTFQVAPAVPLKQREFVRYYLDGTGGVHLIATDFLARCASGRPRTVPGGINLRQFMDGSFVRPGSYRLVVARSLPGATGDPQRQIVGEVIARSGFFNVTDASKNTGAMNYAGTKNHTGLGMISGKISFTAKLSNKVLALKLQPVASSRLTLSFRLNPDGSFSGTANAGKYKAWVAPIMDDPINPTNLGSMGTVTIENGKETQVIDSITGSGF